MRVSIHDSSADLEEQWGAIWAKVTADDSVLLVHLEGHYSLIFAARQWTSGRLTENVSGWAQSSHHQDFEFV